MIDLRDVAQVRAAEALQQQALDDGSLMQRAARALAVTCAALLAAGRGAVPGSRIVLLVGSGNNGGDALWAGALLAARGCRVDAIAVADRVHRGGAAALTGAGGRVHHWSPGDVALAARASTADLVIDGILGIGGTGGLRPEAASLVAAVGDGPIVVAADIPSGVDADTGAVAGDAVTADVTVTFGAVKPGLVVAPGSLHAGAVHLVDIGLVFADPPAAHVLEPLDVAAWLPEPPADSYKYRRGVVAVSAGSVAYPGAALLATSGARRGNVGMTRFLDRSDGCAAMVVGHYPDVVIDGSDPIAQERVDAWACGPGFRGDALDVVTVLAVLAVATPVLLDAGALSVVAAEPAVRDRIAERHALGLVTVLTPHDGEFERLQPGVLATAPGRLAAARRAATSIGAVLVLKGPGTVVAAPDGTAFVDTEGTSSLGSAGSGDVLTGLVGALLAGAWAAGHRDPDDLAEATAAAVWLHGAAGRIAAERAPVVATDVADAIPAAVRRARFGVRAGDLG